MKKILFLLFGTIFLVSCGNKVTGSSTDINEESSEESSNYVYRLAIYKDPQYNTTSFKGLLIGFPHEDGDGYEYLAFDDEMNYNDYAAEFLMAYEIAKNCVNLIFIGENYPSKDCGITCEDIEKALLYIRDGKLPITNEIHNEKLKEEINREYYDRRNVTIYEPYEGYGYRKYPIGNGGNELWVTRIEEDEVGLNSNWINPYYGTTIEGEPLPVGALRIGWNCKI